MAINLSKVQQIFTGGISSSWTDFYLNMAFEMAENVAKRKIVNKLVDTGFGSSVLSALDVSSEEADNFTDNFIFAQSLTEEYDKAIRGGKTIIGGVPITIGNTAAMRTALTGILNSTKNSKNGDLLRDIGPAIQAYWVGALTPGPTDPRVPNIPMIGTVKNLTNIFGTNLSPGIWTPIVVPPMNSISPFLLNFIISASVHLLTVGGLFTCVSQYPPPAPPAPGVLPWAGYFVKPFSGNPISSLDFKDMVSLAGGLAFESLDGALNDGNIASNLATTLTRGFVEGQETQEPQIANAMKSIIYGDEVGMAKSSEVLTQR
jgi:hypothetical protein